MQGGALVLSPPSSMTTLLMFLGSGVGRDKEALFSSLPISPYTQLCACEVFPGIVTSQQRSRVRHSTAV